MNYNIKCQISSKVLLRLSIILLAFTFFLGHAHFALANISFVKDVATANSKTSGTTLVLTVPAAGVTAGNSIIISVVYDFSCYSSLPSLTNQISSIVDSAGNSYIRDASNDNANPAASDCASSTATIRTEVWSVQNIAALSSGNTITLTWSAAVVAKAANASEFSGIAPISPLDRSSSSTGTSTAPASSTTTTTSQAKEVLIGIIAVEGPLGDIFTAGTNYTANPPTADGTTGGATASNVTVYPEYRIVSSTGAYSSSGTLGASRNWIDSILIYKAQLILDHYSISIATPQTAGVCSTGTNTVTAQEVDNTVVTNNTSTVNMTSNGTGITFYTASNCVTPTSSYTLSSGVANIYYKTTTAQSFNITATKASSIETGTSSSIAVNPDTQTRLIITLPWETFIVGSGNTGTVSYQAPGVEFTIPKITATDNYVNIVTSYTGTKTLVYSGPAGSPIYTTSVNFTSGQSTTNLLTTLTTPETTTLTVTDVGQYGYASSSLTVALPLMKLRGGLQIKGGTILR